MYARLRSMLPRDSPFFYLSASPYNLYPFLRDFRDEWYPPGTMMLRNSSWKTISGLLTNLTVGTDDYKLARVKKDLLVVPQAEDDLHWRFHPE